MLLFPINAKKTSTVLSITIQLNQFNLILQNGVELIIIFICADVIRQQDFVFDSINTIKHSHDPLDILRVFFQVVSDVAFYSKRNLEASIIQIDDS